VARTLFRDLGGIVAAAQKLGTERGLHVHVENKVGRFVRLVTEAANVHPRLLVWGSQKDHASPAFHRGVDLLLAARGPVLIV
jgi:hypothetical protein